MKVDDDEAYIRDVFALMGLGSDERILPPISPMDDVISPDLDVFPREVLITRVTNSGEAV